MSAQWTSTLRRAFQLRTAYGRVVPPEARVNPTRFSEVEFPIVCPQCDYLLRGLTTPRCPECGRDFDRGRLLVEQYLIEGGLRTRGKGNKFAKWCRYITVIIIFGVFGAGLSLSLLSLLLPSLSPASWPVTVVEGPVAVFFMLITLCLLVTVPVSVADVLHRILFRAKNRKRARCVLRAIGDTKA